MTKPPFTLARPDRQTTPVVFASPHSGRDYPSAFLRRSVLDERAIRSSEDAFVDQLFGCAPEFGAPLLAATAPRAFIDLNRSAEELDPALIEGVRRSAHNPRVTSGLGVIPRVVANGRAIYRAKLTQDEAQERLRDHWRPYHAQLQALLTTARDLHGQAILIDCHSMPHEAIDSVGTAGTPHPEIVLGDRFGAAAEAAVVDMIEAAFAGAGLRVVRNSPFAGAYTAQHYGRPSRGQHVVQVEIDRALYMDERHVRPNGNFAAFQELMRGVVADLTRIGRVDLPLAAE
ncbi:N-formylglutamate amidohydrolase [Psychromarinibacter sp. C21-152]|uniref:N-formylglutamate amidohydrolase n=1 Tax=Psychromarinibacter sediminicola TaxID=3033385 RepID=A0AAE3NTR1_9RHOB|nr:N-formylglutamate amidohydrolase [Psychromarinibacter sediminicola]MDF0601846.1 N-formylglutamate amidohydrolase [Psychromarinibacter sediminicola]